MARRCLGCGTLCGASRCPSCKRVGYRRRNADRALAKQLTSTATHCARCGCALTHDDPQGPAGPTAQHTVRFRDGGRLKPTDPVLCRSCNASEG